MTDTPAATDNGMPRTIEFSLLRTRYEEDRQTERRRDSFLVPVGPRTTVLDALEYARTHHDEDLMYRHSCHHGSCGTCGMIVNGRRVLACLTSVAALDAEKISVDPLTSMPHYGDLATVPRGFFRDFPVAATLLRASEYLEEALPPAEIERYIRFENCIECGLCNSSCPVTRRFMGPAALAAHQREMENRPERSDELLGTVDQPHGVWACDRALNCSRVCPTGVYPAKQIAVMQRQIRNRGTR